jgi:hypothetical protein
MEQEKIASRLILADGTTFNIGTVGAVENIAVKLSAPTSEDWASMKVVVQNITQATSEEYSLSALGECKFTIPMGNVYSIVYPVLSNYKQPINATFTATLASRSVEYTYSNEEVMYEQINISAQVINGDIAELNGKVVSALSDNGNAYAAEFANGKVTLRIPYGERYKITLPELDGFLHDGTNIQMTAGIPSRFISINYSEGLMGFFGIDDDGNKYTTEKIEQMVADGEDTSIIHYIGYNDAALAIADRGDGTVGCGIIFEVPFVDVKKQWATQNVEFDTTRLPNNGINNNRYNDFRSTYNTTNIEIIGSEIGVDTPAASYCRSQRVTIGGVTRSGNLVASGILYSMKINEMFLYRLGELIGKTVPDLTIGDIVSSTQSGKECIALRNGTLQVMNKDGSWDNSPNRVFCCYDL